MTFGQTHGRTFNGLEVGIPLIGRHVQTTKYQRMMLVPLKGSLSLSLRIACQQKIMCDAFQTLQLDNPLMECWMNTNKTVSYIVVHPNICS